MNKIINFVVDCIVFITLPAFVFAKIKFKEVRKRRYENDEYYTDCPNTWDVAVFLHDEARGRIDLLQTKLSGLLSVLSVLVGVFGLTGVFAKSFPAGVLIACLVLSFLGLLVLIGPLSISTSVVVDLNGHGDSSELSKDIVKEFTDAITDIGCRADFYADCLATAKTLIVIATLLFLIGMVITLLGNQDTALITDPCCGFE
jgi:hypothetical protein